MFSTRQSDLKTIKITIRLVGELRKGDHHYIQFFNIIMRKCLDHLNLQLVGRNFFDAQNKVSFSNLDNILILKNSQNRKYSNFCFFECSRFFNILKLYFQMKKYLNF